MSAEVCPKSRLDHLALFGGSALFEVPRSTSNLVQPNLDDFLSYSRVFYDNRRYTNNGALVKQLEKRLSVLHDTEFCVTFCSGFWALALAISVLAKQGRSEIVMPSLTYRRMADIAAWNGLTPRFCDVDADSLAMAGHSARASVTNETALILGVHPIVNCCDVEGLTSLAAEFDLPLLFDSVESVFETVPAGKVGRFGNAEVFSMHASKLLNGFEGGYVTTNDGVLARRLVLLQGFGFEGPDNIIVAGGMNAKLNEVHAAMALASLDDLDAQISRNRERYRRYAELLPGLPGLRLRSFDESHQTSYKNVLVELTSDWPFSRDETLEILNSENVLARAYYAPPLHKRPTAYPTASGSLYITDALSERFMLMPCGHHVSLHDIEVLMRFLEFISVNAKPIRRRLCNER